MAEPCAIDRALARKNQSAILQRLASVGQKPVADALGMSETWISRWKSEDAKTCADLLSILGVKVVPADHKCFSTEYIASLRYFAKLGMAQEEQPQQLDWSDE